MNSDTERYFSSIKALPYISSHFYTVSGLTSKLEVKYMLITAIIKFKK